jgi:glyoxylase-like metal-dependent hydrolase (beta-lactamase superfamily II)
LLARCSLADLDAVLLTHLHPGHWTDLPLTVHAIAVAAAKRKRPLRVYGPSGWADAVGVNLHWEDDNSSLVYERHPNPRRAGEMASAVRVRRFVGPDVVAAPLKDAAGIRTRSNRTNSLQLSK